MLIKYKSVLFMISVIIYFILTVFVYHLAIKCKCTKRYFYNILYVFSKFKQQVIFYEFPYHLIVHSHGINYTE